MTQDELRTIAAEPDAPDKAGQEWGLVWVGWRQYPEGSGRYGAIKFYVADADTGELIRSTRRRGYGDDPRFRERDYHIAQSWEDVHLRLWRLYWRHKRERIDPLVDLQESIREETCKRAERETWEQRRDIWRSRWTVKTERFDGKTLNRLESA